MTRSALRLRRTMFLALATTVISCWSVVAQQVTPDGQRLAAARAVVEDMRVDAQVARMVPKLQAGLRTQFRTMGLPDDLSEKIVSRVTDTKSAAFQAYINDIKNLQINFFATRFTVSELNTIQSFNSSPVGRKFQLELGEMMEKMAEPLMTFQHRMMEDVQRQLVVERK